MAHAIDREHRLVADGAADELVAGDVLVGHDRLDAGQRERRPRVDPADQRRGVRAAGGRAEKHPRDVEVRGVQELP